MRQRSPGPRTLRALFGVQVWAARGVAVPRRLARALLRRSATRPAPAPVAVHAGTSTGPGAVALPSGPGGRVISVVAHPDDDLLFLSPDLLVSLRTAEAVRTVVLTSGDGGRGRLYAAAREEGLRRAYAGACSAANLWELRRRTVGGHPVREHTLRGDPRVSLVFLRLPDGQPDGAGTRRNRGESLQKLLEGVISRLHPAGGGPGLALPDLLALLTRLLEEFGPTETRTTDFRAAFGEGDHSDHLACARLVRLAHAALPGRRPLTGYLGYPAVTRPANVTEGWLSSKLATVETYAACDPTFRLGFDPGWVARQYVSAREPAAG